MSTIYNILVMYPQHLNLNGDVANAGVLARRMNWYGHSAAIEFHNPGDELPNYLPDFVLFGHGSEAAWADVEEDLTRNWPKISAWFDKGVLGLAINSGQELLHGTSFAYLDGELRAGERVSKFVAVETDLFGSVNNLLGYQNSIYSAPIIELKNSLIGTQLHGPVLAKNSWLADEIIRRITGESELTVVPAAEAQVELVAKFERGIRDLEVPLANE